jgi:hypothetical protein
MTTKIAVYTGRHAVDVETHDWKPGSPIPELVSTTRVEPNESFVVHVYGRRTVTFTEVPETGGPK